MKESFTVFDVETPNGKNDRICFFGLALIENDEIVQHNSWLIDPECGFSQINTGLHGICSESVKGCPRFIDVWPQLESFFSDRIVVAHNASFDLTVLRKTLAHYNITLPPLRFLDTCSLARNFYPELPNCRLDTVCSSLGFSLKHHDAGSDALATADILLDMLHRGLDEKEIHHYSPNNTSLEQRRTRTSVYADMAALRSLISSITEDGEITDTEFLSLLNWLKNHLFLIGNDPFDDILYQVMSIIEDGRADEDELESLCRQLENLHDPVDDHFTTDKPSLQGLKVVLSGNFCRGSKETIAAELEVQGAEIQNSVGKKTGLVLVGSLGNDSWVSVSYGTKIKKAMEYQSQGIPIKIMREEDFFGR
jgi:DNA polymerase III epsilon subunit-like protein